MAERSKAVTLFIFLFFIFIMLGAIIFIFTYSTYRNTSNYSTSTTKNSVDCTGYSFRVVGGTLSYENTTLSLDVDTTLATERQKNSLVFVVNGKETESRPVDFTVRTQKLKIDVEKPGAFDVYVKGCPDIKRKCDLAANQCT